MARFKVVFMLVVALCTPFLGFNKTCTECEKNGTSSPESLNYVSSETSGHISESNFDALQKCNSIEICSLPDDAPSSVTGSSQSTCPLDLSSSSPHTFCVGNTCVDIHSCSSSEKCVLYYICPSASRGSNPDGLENIPELFNVNVPSTENIASKYCTPDVCAAMSCRQSTTSNYCQKLKFPGTGPSSQDVSTQYDGEKDAHFEQNAKILKDYAFYDEVDPKILSYPDKKRKSKSKSGYVFKFEIQDAIDHEQQKTHDCKDEFWSSVIQDLLVESEKEEEKDSHEKFEIKQQAMKESTPDSNIIQEGQEKQIGTSDQTQETTETSKESETQTLQEEIVMEMTNNEVESIDAEVIQAQEHISQVEKEIRDTKGQDIEITVLQTDHQIQKEDCACASDGTEKVKEKNIQTQEQITELEIEPGRADRTQIQGMIEKEIQTEQNVLDEGNAIGNENDADIGKADILQIVQNISPQVSKELVVGAHGVAEEVKAAVGEIHQTLEQVMLEAQVKAVFDAIDVVKDAGAAMEEIQMTLESTVHEALERTLNETSDVVKEVQGNILEIKDAMENVELEAIKALENRGEEIMRTDEEKYEKPNENSCEMDKIDSSLCSENLGEKHIEGSENVQDLNIGKKPDRSNYPFLSDEAAQPTELEETSTPQNGRCPYMSKRSNGCKDCQGSAKQFFKSTRNKKINKLR